MPLTWWAAVDFRCFLVNIVWFWLLQYRDGCAEGRAISPCLCLLRNISQISLGYSGFLMQSKCMWARWIDYSIFTSSVWFPQWPAKWIGCPECPLSCVCASWDACRLSISPLPQDGGGMKDIFLTKIQNERPFKVLCCARLSACMSVSLPFSFSSIIFCDQ